MTRDTVLTMKRQGPRADGRRPTANDQRPHATIPPRRSERGYILLMLMLFVTLMVIAAGVAAPTMAFRVRRDREEEMIHRGTQYSRAIQRFVKKTGRYPSRLEDLENTNNIRFLRRRYKDPITGKDFKLLHVGEVQLTGSPGIAGASPIGSPAAQAGGAALQGAASAVLGGAAAQAAPATAATPGANPPGDAGADSASANPDSPDSSKSDSSAAGGIGSAQLSSAVFGGGPIVGVASISKATTIREFNHKNRYNQWQFIYDPTSDRGGLLMTPNQPPLMINSNPTQQQNGMPSTTSGPGPGSNPGPPPAQPNQQ
jgi:type II secretory pathway pseudopilin PulG